MSKNISILFQFFVPSVSSNRHFNVQVYSDSSNTFIIKLFRLSKLKENNLDMSGLDL